MDISLYIGCIGLVPIICFIWAFSVKGIFGKWPKWLLGQAKQMQDFVAGAKVEITSKTALNISIVMLILGAVIGIFVELSILRFYGIL